MTTSTREIKKVKNDDHNNYVLKQARELNFDFKQPIYCAVNEDGHIFDLSIGEAVFPNNYFIYDEYNEWKQKQKIENEIKEEHNFRMVGKTLFTFTYDGEEYTGQYSRKPNSCCYFYRLLGLKAKTFANLVKKL
jgi:hypothetical protein